MANLKYDKKIAAPIKDDANVSWRLTRAAQFLGIGYRSFKPHLAGCQVT
jgi:hypothetical protein